MTAGGQAVLPPLPGWKRFGAYPEVAAPLPPATSGYRLATLRVAAAANRDRVYQPDFTDKG